MLKLLAFITAKPELSRDEFIDYYEHHHVPLVRRLLPMVGEYRRSYVTPELQLRAGPELDYDVMTELLFANQAALDDFWRTIQRPEVIAAIREDEANFLVSERTRMVGAVQYQAD